MNFYIILHLIMSVLAIPMGTYILSRTKGDRLHKATGKVWSGLVLSACVISLSIRNNAGELFFLHLLSSWMFLMLSIALIAIRLKKVKWHQRFVWGTFIVLNIETLFVLFMPNNGLSFLSFSG